MPTIPLRPVSALRASRAILTHNARTSTSPIVSSPLPNSTASAPATVLGASRSLSQSRALRAADADHGGHHEDHFDPPAGWLWGVKPGEKYQKEGWEGVFMWGFGGSMVLLFVGYAFKPDTSIQTWALEEARRRLEAEGILKEPEDKS